MVNYDAQTDITSERLENLRLQRDLDALKKSAKKTEESLRQVSQGTLPGLKLFEFEKAIPLDQKFVRQIAFEPVGVSEGHRNGFQVRLSLRNEEATATQPRLSLIFFARDGDVLGNIQLGLRDLPMDFTFKGPRLQPGEQRSFLTDIIRFPEKEIQPFCFLLASSHTGQGSE
jgi:hypothetical protein